jgi:diguanylate cyclase (GGDEF)-like protein
MHLALSGGKKFDVEYRIMTDNAKFCAVRSASIYRYSQSKGGLIVNGVTWDISSHRKLVEENKKLATLDPLTSAKNRRGFYPLARAEFNRCRRYGGKLAILMIDIDNFKTINDTSGHSMGDSTLVTLVDVCHAVLRTSDLFCRLGGEEFIALLHENSIKQAHVVAERLRTEIENVKVKSEESSIKFTISIGISVLIEADQTIEDTISRADNALYKAKSNGKNCVVSDA